jgi:Fic-DOC domain mobile mystery protein B
VGSGVTNSGAGGGSDARPDGADGSTAFTVSRLGPEPDGATPLDEDELSDLIPDFVATRGDLNLVEYENITKALPWSRAQATRGGAAAVLAYGFLFELHRRMFGDVWKWAGTQRRRLTNIGVDPAQISEQVKQTLDDASFWHDQGTCSADELAARLHHRLVAVHPFPNGNGRCTRLVADLYLLSIGEATFSWGAGGRLDEDGAARDLYLEALRAADAGDYEPLLGFARS